MTARLDALNALGLLAAVALAVAGPALVGPAGVAPAGVVTHGATPGSTARPVAPGPVVDATGVAVAPRDFRRIVSGSPTADALLVRLVSRARLAAVTAWSAGGPEGWRYAGLATVERVGDVERLLSLRPDLVIVHDYGEVDTVTRLREAGLAVFDLGAATGVDALVEDARQLGALLGRRDRADALARAFSRRIRAVAADVPRDRRPRAAYAAVYGDRLFGAGIGSSQHDVLVYAGLRDVAAEAGLRGWPQYAPERWLALAPDLVVTQPGMGAPLCALPGLGETPPCTGEGGARVVEVPGLDDAGPGMLDTAERLHDRVFGGD